MSSGEDSESSHSESSQAYVSIRQQDSESSHSESESSQFSDDLRFFEEAHSESTEFDEEADASEEDGADARWVVEEQDVLGQEYVQRLVESAQQPFQPLQTAPAPTRDQQLLLASTTRSEPEGQSVTSTCQIDADVS